MTVELTVKNVLNSPSLKPIEDVAIEIQTSDGYKVESSKIVVTNTEAASLTPYSNINISPTSYELGASSEYALFYKPSVVLSDMVLKLFIPS